MFRTATIYFYGDAATTENASAIAQNIQNRWNAANGYYDINGKRYKVRFKIKGIKVSLEKAEKIASRNRSAKNNFVRVETTKDSPSALSKDRSENKIGENAGYYVTTDNLNSGTTPAHEFGHGFGLLHPNDTDPAEFDQRGKGRPHIMRTRGTLVDAAYTWNPVEGPTRIEPDTTTGKPVAKNTMDPESREVTQDNIEDVLRTIPLRRNRRAAIGRATNLIYHDKNDSATPAISK